MILLYSNGCPCCKVMKDKLDKAGIAYQLVTDIQQMLDLGITYLPMLSVDGNMMNYPAALAWLNERTNPHAN